MSFSNHLENILLDCIFGKIWYIPPKLWLGLNRADPLEDGSGITEASEPYFTLGPGPVFPTGYARVETYPTDWHYADDGTVVNSQALTFPTAINNWGECTHFMLFDAIWMILYGELSPALTIVTGQRARFNPTKLEIHLD